MLEIGFHLVSSKWTICNCFVDAGVKACFISPEAVSNYLANVEQIADAYPCHITKSKFRHPRTLQIVLEYCLIGAENPADLKGLPLHLTGDDMLGIFSFTNSVYVTHHSGIFPNIPELFIHQTLVFQLTSWFTHEDRAQLCFSSGMFKEFTLWELELHLPKHLPTEWKERSRHVPWTPEVNGHPSEKWLKELWSFISERCNATTKTGRELDALYEWAIYPTTCGKVVSPKLSKTILYLDKFSDTRSRQKVTQILQKLGCTTLSVSKMSVDNDHFSDVLLQILASQLAVPTKQPDVLTVIRHMLDVEHVTIHGKLNSAECDALLRYFKEGCEAGNDFSQYDFQTLKRLPIFPAAIGNQVSSICSATQCHTVASCDLPANGIDSILSTAGCVLLKSNPMLELLYQRLLNITPINTAGIFLKYILPNVHTLDHKTELAYVEHIKDKVIKNATKEETQSLYSLLKQTAFITDVHGHVHTTNYYYDPSNEVFKCMIDSANLLPERFTEYSWRTFLHHIGLQHKVTKDMFMKFSRQIADKSTQIKADDDYKRLMKQSTTLVEQLDRNKLLWNSSFLRQIADIKFIPSISIEKELREIHPSYSGDKRAGFEPFISYSGAIPARYKELAWSVAMILPSWAIPREEYVCEDDHYRVIERIKVHKCLGIENDVIMEKILQHIQKVCDLMAQRNAVDKIDDVPRPVRQKLVSVIKKMMEHLLKTLSSHTADIKRYTGCPKINFTFLNVNNVRINIRIATPAIYIDRGHL